jgi:uncharacterized protein YcnI
MRLRGLLAVALATGIAVFGFAASAAAHVTVNPNQASQGGYARIDFQVPSESDTAATTKLDVYLPTDHPVASVSTMPVPGWTVQVTTSKLATPLTDDDGNQVTEAVSQITWTASRDAAIKPGQFQEFPVSLGPLPKTDQLVFKVLQTYSDGSVVRWIDTTTPGQAEPEHSAPVLKLSAGTAEVTTPAPGTTNQAATPGSTSNGNGWPLALSAVGTVLGLAGLVLGALAFARTRRTAAEAAPAVEREASPAIER